MSPKPPEGDEPVDSVRRAVCGLHAVGRFFCAGTCRAHFVVKRARFITGDLAADYRLLPAAPCHDCRSPHSKVSLKAYRMFCNGLGFASKYLLTYLGIIVKLFLLRLIRCTFPLYDRRTLS